MAVEEWLEKPWGPHSISAHREKMPPKIRTQVPYVVQPSYYTQTHRHSQEKNHHCNKALSHVCIAA